MNLKKSLKLVGLTLALVLLALSAGSSRLEGEGLYTNSSEESTRVAFSPSPTAVSEAQYGGRLNIAVPYELREIDPHYVSVTGIAENTILTHIFETLIEVTPEGKLKPLLAGDWRWYKYKGEDYLVLDLRSGIKFHDGEPFNAEAVKYNFSSRILNPECATVAGYFLKVIKEIIVLKDYEIAFKTGTIVHQLPWLLAQPNVSIISPKQIKKALALGGIPCGKGLDRKPIGTGPFKFVEWKKDENYVLVEKNGDYWRSRPYLDTIRFKFIAEDSARVVSLEKGYVDVAMQVPPLDVPRLEKDPKLRIYLTPSIRTVYIGMNNRRRIPDKEDDTPNPLSDKRVRQAINYCVDKEIIINVVFGDKDKARVSDAPIPPPVFGYTKVGPYPYDVAKGKNLLVEAGVKELKFEVLVLEKFSRDDVRAVEAIGGMLTMCGIDLEIRKVPRSVFFDLLLKGDFDMYLLSYIAYTFEAYRYLLEHFHSAGPQNYMGFNVPDVDSFIERATMAIDHETVKKLYGSAISTIWHYAPWLFLYEPVWITGIRKTVRDIVIHPTGRVIAWQAWLEKE